MAHTIINSIFINLVKRQPLLDARTLQYIPANGHKHYKPEFKVHRRLKNQLLPQYTTEHDLPDRGPSSRHKDFNIHGRYWQEPRTVASYTNGLIDAYDPLKDKEKSWLSPKAVYSTVRDSRKNKKGIKEIQSFDERFEMDDFIDECEGIYKEANKSIAEKDEDKMLDYLTPYAYKVARDNIKNKRIHWKFLNNVELPKVLHVRVATPSNTGGGTDESFAQITVRLHTQQTLAVYDRFGRLVMGSEILAKDVLELVVYEKRMSHLHGKWRVHDKIPVPEGAVRTELRQTSCYKEIPEGEEQQQEVERIAPDATPAAQNPGETKPETVVQPQVTKQ